MSSTNISKGNNVTTELISLLVDLATIEAESSISDIVPVTQQATSKVMNAIGAADFLNGALVMLQSDETRIKAGTLEVLAERVPKVTEAVHREQQKTAISIIDCIRDVVSRQSAGALVNSALNALRAISSSIGPGKESALVSTVLSVIKIIKAPQSSGDGAIFTLQGLVSTLPAFNGTAELTAIVKLHLEYSVTLSGPMAGLMNAKKISSNTLLPEHVDGLIAFSVFFKRSLRVARRPDIQEHIRSIFSAFLNDFGVNMNSTTGSRDTIVPRLCDWAFAAESTNTERKITFCHMYSALLDYFKENPPSHALDRTRTPQTKGEGDGSADGMVTGAAVTRITLVPKTSGAVTPRQSALKLTTQVTASKVLKRPNFNSKFPGSCKEEGTQLSCQWQQS
ncbi:hypothetical protein EDB19DRAFT_1943251 [Suillus lakei]|nr:hypothetical protein EDB19DRAFT_1943251 [Suillus lakei]